MGLIKYNNLGKFGDVSAVWDKHPEGGREGDYVTIGNTAYYWDNLTRNWVMSGGGGSSNPASQTVDGDLNVGGDLNVAGDANVTGDVTIHGQLYLSNGDRYKGQSSYKSIVFTRSDEQPDAPTGGLFSRPYPDGNVWKDGIPVGTKPIWMSSRVFTSDGKAPATNDWSTPALMSDAEDFDVEFSTAPTDTVPPPPASGPNGNLGWLWFDPVRNPNAEWDKMNWMATRSKSQGAWSTWTIMLIKGETGDGVQSVFTVTDGSTPSISGSGYPPSGWYKSVDSLTVNQGEVLWMSERRFESGAWSAWSAPVRLNGVDGQAGEDGTDIEFIYKRMNRLPNTGGNTDEAPDSVDADGAVPTAEGWEDHPSGVDSTHLYEWSCQRTKSNGAWGPWTGPFVWSAFGQRGMDGDGVEYVFIRTTIFTAPTITDAAVQDAEQYPEVANYSSSYNTGEIDGNTFFDNPKGVGPTWLYEWVSKRKKVNGVWGTFSAPALWATYSEEHTIDIDEVTGCWIIDGHPTDKKAIGQGVAVKGRVDVYLDTDKTSSSQKSLESYPSSLTGDNALEIGDCWIVENGTDVAGHLFLCVATTGTISTMWQDLGEFKGEPGQSQYMHIAWASKINFTGNPQHFASAENFTKNYVAGQSYDWMGVVVDSTESDANLEAVNYKWNYLKGKDGNDVEYVYLRTKVNTAPTITETAVQTPERYPAVANYSNGYAAGDAEHDTFTDDPNGVDGTWKYEWVSRREKSYNENTGKMEWGKFLSPAKLWAKWGDAGQPGESATTIKPSVVQIVIDTNASGDLPVNKRTQSVTFRLFYGNTQVTPTSYSATYGGSAVSNIQRYTNNSDPRVVVTVGLPSTGATTKDIVVNMSDGTHGASANVPIIINRAGQDGRDVYKSIVFMRSASKPGQPNTGDYYSPVPSDTHNDGGVTRQWKDGVDAGTLPVWMTSRIFSSDNQSPPQESAWSDVVLMQDTDMYDVEFTDADPETPPGTPDDPASNVTWYDPVDDAAEFANRSMNWMAQRVKVVTANGTGWSNWVVNRIRGEKGNDGAGQAYVAAVPDKIVVDCNAEGESKGDISETVTVYLMWGDEKCALKSSCSVSYSGGGTLTRSPFQQGDDELEFMFEVANNASIQSGLIQITLIGTDSNSVEHIALLSIPVHVNMQGAKGVKGDTGAVLRFRGVWSDKQDAEYVWNANYRDCVKYSDGYYMVGTYGATLGYQDVPGVSNGWTYMGASVKFFATELLLAENGAINLLSSNVINLFNANSELVAKINGNGEGSYCIYYPGTTKKWYEVIPGWNVYYNNDADNTEAWRLGQSGVIVKSNVINFDSILLSEDAITRQTPLNASLDLDMVTRFWYHNEGHNDDGKVYDSGNITGGTPSGNHVAEGWYAMDVGVCDVDDSDMNNPVYTLKVCHVDSTGRITQIEMWTSQN